MNYGNLIFLQGECLLGASLVLTEHRMFSLPVDGGSDTQQWLKSVADQLVTPSLWYQTSPGYLTALFDLYVFYVTKTYLKYW